MRQKDLSGAALKNKKKREAKSGRVEEQSKTTATTDVNMLFQFPYAIVQRSAFPINMFYAGFVERMSSCILATKFSCSTDRESEKN